MYAGCQKTARGLGAPNAPFADRLVSEPELTNFGKRCVPE